MKKWRGDWILPVLVLGMNATCGFVADPLVYGPGYSFTVKGQNGVTMNWHEAVQARLVSLRATPPNAQFGP